MISMRAVRQNSCIPRNQSGLLMLEGYRIRAFTDYAAWQRRRGTLNGQLHQTKPNDANALIEAQPSATPRTAPASTSLKKCMPSTMRDTAMLTARKNNGASSPG